MDAATRSTARSRRPHVRLLVPEGDNAKQMSSSELITFAGLTDEWQSPTGRCCSAPRPAPLLYKGVVVCADINGMIESYVEEADKAGLGWTKQEAEWRSRYLMRQAPADEGGLDGDGQDEGQPRRCSRWAFRPRHRARNWFHWQR